jgi:hypothetical protein
MSLIPEGTGPPAAQLFYSARVQSHIFKQPNQGSQAACFTPADVCLKRHPKSLSIARFLLLKPNHIEKPTSTRPHIIETDRLALARIGGLCFLYAVAKFNKLWFK